MYWLDEGDATGTFPVHCDMTTDGGAWTLVHETDKSSGADRTASGANVAALETGVVNTVAVLPRATIAAIGTTFRATASDGAHELIWTNLPYFTDDGTVNPPTATSIQVQLAWSAPWVTGSYDFHTQHSVCIRSDPADPNGQEHACSTRWCCGEPSEGLWFNGGAWAPGGYYAGTWAISSAPASGRGSG